MRSMAVLAVLAAALSLGAEPRLIEPRDGAELAGGSLVTIEWTGDVAPGVEEWEAFLSVDGGRWYSTRITPHLDADVRRFTFEVPNVATRDARILLRFGDEKHETEVDVPSRFAIRFDPATVRMQVAIAANDGEPARRGQRGVAQWVSGARDGSRLRTFAHREHSYRDAPAFRTASTHEENAEGDDGDSAVSTRSDTCAPLRTTPQRTSTRALPRVPDLLLATRRLNV